MIAALSPIKISVLNAAGTIGGPGILTIGRCIVPSCIEDMGAPIGV